MQNVKSQLAMMALAMFSRHPQVSPVGPANPQRKPERIKGLQSCGPVHSRWLMGFPPEWDVFAAMVTPLSRKSRRLS